MSSSVAARGGKRTLGADQPTTDRVLIAGVTSPMHTKLSAFRKQSKLVDVQIRTADGERFDAHRCVLAAGSDFMSALFDSGMRDSDSEVSLDGVSADLFAAVLDFIYQGSCVVDAAQLPELLETAAHLQALLLQERVLDALHARLVPGNALTMWRLGEKLTMPALTTAAIRVGAEKIESLATSDAMLEATYEELATLLLHANLRKSIAREAVFQGLGRWEAAQKPPALMTPLFAMWKERVEEHSHPDEFISVHLVTTEHLRASCRVFDLVNFRKPACANREIHIKKQSSVLQLQERIWRLTGVKPAAQRLWQWACRQNKTFRVDRCIHDRDEDGDSISSSLHPVLFVGSPSNAEDAPTEELDLSCWLYLEVLDDGPWELPGVFAEAPNEGGPPMFNCDDLLLFVKFFEPQTQRLTFVDSIVANRHQTLDDVKPLLLQARGLPADQMVAVYEELEWIHQGPRLLPIEPGHTLKELQLQTGDIIVFQTCPPQLPMLGLAMAGDTSVDEKVFPLTIPQFYHAKHGGK